MNTQKKAFIGAMMLGFLLISTVFVFVATVSDEVVVRDKITEIKKVTDNTAKALAKHYLINGSTDSAEQVGDGLLDKTNVGTEVKSSLVYTWDFVTIPNSVTVSLPTYEQETFWYKILGKDSFTLDNIESRAEIIIIDPIKESSVTLAPLAINNCDRDDLISNAEIDLTFITSPYYENDDTNTFYAVDKDCSFPAGNSNFAHFKILFTGGEVDYSSYDVNDNNEDACLVQTSFQNPLSVDPKQLYNQLKHFDLPYQMDILMFECGTTADNLIINNVLSIEMSHLYPLVSGDDLDGQKTNILKMTAKVVSSSQEIVLKY